MSFGKPEFIGKRGASPSWQPPVPTGIVKAGILILPALILTYMLYFSFLEYVRPNEFGIKEVKIGVNRGIQEADYGPGYWLVLPFGMQVMHRFPRSIQVLEMTEGKPIESKSAAIGDGVHYENLAKIQTSDGFFVDVDVSILYRIVDPHKVIVTLGRDEAFLYNGVQPRAQPALKQTLGQLTTEQFYDSDLRVAKANEARELLNAELEPKGIEIIEVLVRYFQYVKSIQDNIEAKKLQDQLFFTNQSKSAAAKEQQQLDRVTAEGEQQVKLTIQEGEAYRARQEAEAELYTRKKHAEADLLVKLAEAERTELRNQSMQSLGSERMVALKMAEVMRGLDTIVLPAGGQSDLNPLDLSKMLEVFGLNLEAPGTAQKQTSTPAPAPATTSVGDTQ